MAKSDTDIALRSQSLQKYVGNECGNYRQNYPGVVSRHTFDIGILSKGMSGMRSQHPAKLRAAAWPAPCCCVDRCPCSVLYQARAEVVAGSFGLRDPSKS